MIFLYTIIFILGIFLLISIYNYFTAPEIKSDNLLTNGQELISVLVPVRNEEHNIKTCIRSILEQDYTNIEIIVLDDFSSDNTFKYASEFTESKIKILKGKELPDKWIGKNWACHQLSKESKANYLLFLDSDVILKPAAISSAFNELKNCNVKLISVFPTQIFKSLGEFLVVPLMNWLLLTFLPLNLVYRSNHNSFVAANGQFMLWKRFAYDKIGGHAFVYDKIVEDMEFARECKKQKLKIKTLLGGDLIFCNMYNSFNEAIKGYQKNFYPGFSVHPIMFLLIISFLFFVFMVPFFLFDKTFISILPLLFVIIIRALVSLKSKQNFIFNLLLHPFQMIIMFSVGIISVIKSEFHSLEWKSRKI